MVDTHTVRQSLASRWVIGGRGGRNAEGAKNRAASASGVESMQAEHMAWRWLIAVWCASVRACVDAFVQGHRQSVLQLYDNTHNMRTNDPLHSMVSESTPPAI